MATLLAEGAKLIRRIFYTHSDPLQVEKLKIAIAFGQAATSSLQEFRLEYPPIVIGALAALGSLNFDIFSVLSVGCLVSFDFFDTLVVTCIAPVLLAAVTLV